VCVRVCVCVCARVCVRARVCAQLMCDGGESPQGALGKSFTTTLEVNTVT